MTSFGFCSSTPNGERTNHSEPSSFLQQSSTELPVVARHRTASPAARPRLLVKKGSSFDAGPESLDVDFGEVFDSSRGNDDDDDDGEEAEGQDQFGSNHDYEEKEEEEERKNDFRNDDIGFASPSKTVHTHSNSMNNHRTDGSSKSSRLASTDDSTSPKESSAEPDFPLNTDADRLAYIEYYLEQFKPKERHFKCKLCFEKAFLNCYKVRGEEGIKERRFSTEVGLILCE